ncbi:MAG: hypothetical protein U1E17_06115 [Geminicoccaceae bacterium]
MGLLPILVYLGLVRSRHQGRPRLGFWAPPCLFLTPPVVFIALMTFDGKPGWKCLAGASVAMDEVRFAGRLEACPDLPRTFLHEAAAWAAAPRAAMHARTDLTYAELADRAA